MNTKMSTPWGQADQVVQIAPGISKVYTPSHGGIHLDAAHIKRIPRTLNAGYSGSLAWWEEDCDWAVPYLLFEAEFAGWECVKRMGAEEVRRIARASLGQYNAPWLEAIDAFLSAKSSITISRAAAGNLAAMAMDAQAKL